MKRLKLKYKLFVFLSLWSSLAYAQTPWVRTYGGPNEDKGQSLILAPDSGFYVVGYTGSMGFGASDMYILKTDSLGLFQWQKTIGTNNIDIAEKIIESNTPNAYFIAGYSNGFFPYEYDFYFAKIDANGDTIRTQHSGTDEWDLCHSAVATGDGYLMVGETFKFGQSGTHGYIVKVDENLDTVRTYIHQMPVTSVFKDIIKISATKNLIVGYTLNVANDSTDGYAWVVDNDGNILNDIRINYGKNEILTCAAASFGNGIMLGGYFSYDSTQFHKSLQVKLSDSADAILWHLMAPELDDYGLQINAYAHLGNDAFIMAGESRYKYNDDHQAVVIRSFPDGLPFFNKESGIIEPKDGFFGIVRGHDNGLVATGYTRSYGPGIQALILSKFGEFGSVATSVTLDEENFTPSEWAVYPNPAQNLLYIQSVHSSHFQLLDMTGRVMKIGAFNGAGNHSLSISELPSAIYFLILKGENGAYASFKIIKN